MTTYVELSKSEHGHGGVGWEFGTCLWSPFRNRRGADRYSLMREPRKGDRIFHIFHTEHSGITDRFLLGESRVSASVIERESEPPSPGPWDGMGVYYRIDLDSYTSFPKPITVRVLLSEYEDEIRDDLLQNSPRFYPFTTHGASVRTVQGIYLARATGTLEAILDRSLSLEIAQPPRGPQDQDPHKEYAESKRRQRERFFFARNPALAAKAKERDGYRCVVCGFNFSERYSEIGENFIEAHHVDPLAERPEREWSDVITTSLDRVVSLCANCHRMIHRRKPAMTVAELRESIRM